MYDSKLSNLESPTLPKSKLTTSDTGFFKKKSLIATYRIIDHPDSAKGEQCTGEHYFNFTRID